MSTSLISAFRFQSVLRFLLIQNLPRELFQVTSKIASGIVLEQLHILSFFSWKNYHTRNPQLKCFLMSFVLMLVFLLSSQSQQNLYPSRPQFSDIETFHDRNLDYASNFSTPHLWCGGSWQQHRCSVVVCSFISNDTEEASNLAS